MKRNQKFLEEFNEKNWQSRSMFIFLSERLLDLNQNILDIFLLFIQLVKRISDINIY